MKVSEIMNANPVTVRIDQTFAEGLEILLRTHHTMLPVVDGDGVYRGIFDVRDIWRILLPKAAKLTRRSLEDLSFAHTSPEKMREQIAAASELPIGRFVTKEDLPALTPECTVIQAVLMLDEHGETMAVVDKATRRLVGVLAPWQVLDILR
jgi:CBS domain-containing protein